MDLRLFSLASTVKSGASELEGFVFMNVLIKLTIKEEILLHDSMNILLCLSTLPVNLDEALWG